MGSLQQMVVLSFAVLNLAAGAGASAQDATAPGKFYTVIDGKVDARTYDGFRRYHAGCNHCHGPDGVGSMFAPSLVGRLPDIEAFRRAVLDGQTGSGSVMKGFADDPNFAPYVDEIYAYLQARTDGALGRGRPGRLQP
jgi:mono/diheme cytochrome c family protein